MYRIRSAVTIMFLAWTQAMLLVLCAQNTGRGGLLRYFALLFFGSGVAATAAAFSKNRDQRAVNTQRRIWLGIGIGCAAIGALAVPRFGVPAILYGLVFQAIVTLGTIAALGPRKTPQDEIDATGAPRSPPG